MENTIIKEMPIEVQKRIDAVIESEFDLDIRVFTLAPTEGGKEPHASGLTCTFSCSCLACGPSFWSCAGCTIFC